MIIDNNAVFSGSIVGSTVTGQALTTGTITSTNVYDLQQARDIGKGEDFVVPIEVTTAFTGGTSVQAQFVQADDAGISVNVNVLSAGPVVPLAQLTAGARFVLEVGRVDPNVNRRYLAIQYVIVGTFTAGAVFSALQPNLGISDVPEYYPSGFQVL